MRGRLPDPSWKKHGPPDPPSPSASEHAFWDEPAMDVDGPGVNEAQRVDGEVICAVREYAGCVRDGCDGGRKVVHLYRVEDVDDVVRQGFTSAAVGGDEPGVILGERAQVVDHDGEEAYIGFEEYDGSTIGYVAPCETIVKDDGRGPCYGHVEPDPEPYGL